MADKLPFGVAGPAEDVVDPAPVLGSLAMGVLNIPKHLIDASANAVPGLRKEDVTDNPNAAQPNQPMYNAAADTAMALAGTGAPAAEVGAAGIFGGKLAKTADVKALIEANQMYKGGKGQAQIYGDTGWFQSPTDRKWKFEIPDNNARVNQIGLDYAHDGRFYTAPAGAMYEHPELYAAYPDLRNVKMYNTVMHDPKNGMGAGSFNPNGKVLEVSAPNLGNARSIATHEMQHAVQNIENFAPGGNPSHMAHLQESLPEKLPLHEQESAPYDLYHRLAGEVEARNAQTRMDFDPTHRQMVAPWETHDTKYRDQLVYDPRYNFVRALKNSQ